MKKLMTIFALFIVLMAYSITPVDAAEKRVLVEDHTGAWCGYCPIGIHAMDDLYKLYPDKFIPVAVHSGDKMQMSHQNILADTFSITSVPAGVINRKKISVNGAAAQYAVHPGYWTGLVPSLFTETSIVDITSVEYNVDKVAKTLTATITVVMEEDYPGQLAFNLYIMEDGLTGSGEGWDQENYLSGDAAYQDNPFYSLPSVVKGYVHDNVVKDMLGDAFGINGEFPATAVKGVTYKHTFTRSLSDLSVQNMDNLWVVGTVAKTGTEYEIMNSLAAGKKMPKPKYSVVTATAKTFFFTERNSTFTNQFTVENKNTIALDADIAIDETESSIPTGWVVTLDKNTVNITANQKATVGLSVQTNGEPGIANILVKSTVKATDYYLGLSNSVGIFALTDGYENIVYHFGDKNANGFYQAISNLDAYKNTTAFIPVSDESMTTYSNYNYNTLIVPESFESRGAIANSPKLIQYVKSRVDAGKPVLMTSVVNLFFVGGNDPQYNPVQSIKDFFTNTWGINGLTQSAPYASGNANSIYRIGILGNDPQISNDMTFNINDNTTYYTMFLDQVKVVNNAIATPILKYNISKTDEESVAAVKIQTPTNKNIYVGFGIDAIGVLATRTTLLGNMLSWLSGTTDVKDFDNLNTSNISIYPNPCVSTSTIKFEANNPSDNADVYLVNETGARVMTISNNTSITAGTNQFELNASNLSSGKYYVMTKLNGVYSQTSIVVSK